MTGRPATRISGLGVVCVCGRRRVPFPARGIIAFMRIGYGFKDDLDRDTIETLWNTGRESGSRHRPRHHSFTPE